MKRKEIFEILESCKEGERSQGMHGISMADTIVKVEEIGQDSIGTTAKVSFPGALPGSGQILKKIRMKRKENKLTDVLISLDSDHQKTMLTNLGMSMNPSTDADTIYNIGSTLLSAGYPEEAYKLISRSATNHLPSLTKKADMLLNGVGTERDAAGALKYYKKAAEAGDTWSHIKVAVLLETGAPGIEVNHAQANEYLNIINNNIKK